jgi:two-component system, OmpR family, phosphate regulon response regulator PhoB
MRVAIIEDDIHHSSALRQMFSGDGASAEVFSHGQRFLQYLARSEFDLALLDLRLPDISGLEVLRGLQARSSVMVRPLPVMVLTGSAEPGHMQKAFDGGAIDYVLKPCRFHELLIRAKAIARRANPQLFNEAPLTAGDICLNLGTLQAFVAQQEVHLTAKEFRLAWLLFRRQGQLVSRDEILRLVWGRAAGLSSRSLDTHIGRLRRKLDLDQRPFIRLRPVYGMGYRIDVFS